VSGHCKVKCQLHVRGLTNTVSAIDCPYNMTHNVKKEEEDKISIKDLNNEDMMTKSGQKSKKTKWAELREEYKAGTFTQRERESE